MNWVEWNDRQESHDSESRDPLRTPRTEWIIQKTDGVCDVLHGSWMKVKVGVDLKGYDKDSVES